MKKLATFTAAAALGAAFVLAGPGHVMAGDDTLCDTAIGTPLAAATHENVIVEDGKICTLDSGAIVKKDVIVQPGGALDLRGTNVGENIKAEGALWIVLSGAASDDPFEAGKNVEIKGTTGDPPLGTQFDPGVDLTANFICNGIIGENLQLEENETRFVVGDNDPPFGSSNCGLPLAVGKNLQAYKNVDLTISDNVDTTVLGPGGATDAGIGEDLQVYDSESDVKIVNNSPHCPDDLVI